MVQIDKRDEDLRMLSMAQVLDLFPVSRTSLYRLISRGQFPSPLKIGGGNFWTNADIRIWLDQQKKHARKKSLI